MRLQSTESVKMRLRSGPRSGHSWGSLQRYTRYPSWIFGRGRSGEEKGKKGERRESQEAEEGASVVPTEKFLATPTWEAFVRWRCAVHSDDGDDVVRLRGFMAAAAAAWKRRPTETWCQVVIVCSHASDTLRYVTVLESRHRSLTSSSTDPSNAQTRRVRGMTTLRFPFPPIPTTTPYFHSHFLPIPLFPIPMNIICTVFK